MANLYQAPRTVRGKRTHYNQARRAVKGKGTHNNQAPRKRQNSTTSMSLSPGYANIRIIFGQKMWKLNSHPRILKIWWWIRNQRPQKHQYTDFHPTPRFFGFSSAILAPPSRILKIWWWIHNQRPQKPQYTDFHQIPRFFGFSSAILSPPSWILKIWWWIRNHRSQKSQYTDFYLILRLFGFSSAVLNPPSLILKIWWWIRNQWQRKLPCMSLEEYWTDKIICSINFSHIFLWIYGELREVRSFSSRRKNSVHPWLIF